jgi:hypothetical protein
MDALMDWAHKQLVAILWWAFKKLDTWLVVLDPPREGPSALVLAAQELTRDWERQLGPGYGEAKRRQVYAALMDRFPATPKRELSRAIEGALL